MRTAKKDTVITIKRRINPDSIKYLINDEVFTAKGDTILFVRDIPSGMLYTAERAREHKVKVKWDAPVGGSPVGHMVFGDTAKYTNESTLMLDGQWLPIKEQPGLSLASDTISATTSAHQAPQSFIIEHPVSNECKKSRDYGNYVDALSLEMLIGFTVYIMLSLPEMIKSRLKDA